jgi:hypothetical protein
MRSEGEQKASEIQVSVFGEAAAQHSIKRVLYNAGSCWLSISHQEASCSLTVKTMFSCS